MGLISGLLCLLVILFAGALVFSVIMYFKDSLFDNTGHIEKKSFNTIGNSSRNCLECGHRLSDQHTFCPYCGNNQLKHDKIKVKNDDVKNETETESNLYTKIDNNEENREVIKVSNENFLDNNLEGDTENTKTIESDAVLNIDDVNSVNNT